MTIRLVDKGWARETTDAVTNGGGEIPVMSPFVKAGALRRFLSPKPTSLQVITRFNLQDFAEGVSDIAALRMLLDAGGTVRGVRNLHAKLYLFGTKRVLVTSANLTEAALSRNHEFGFVSQDGEVIATCGRYFDDLWSRGGVDLTPELLDRWDQVVTHHRASGGRPDQQAGLGDFGADAGFAGSAPFAVSAPIAEAPQAFVKFLGVSSDRVPLTFSTAAVELSPEGKVWLAARLQAAFDEHGVVPFAELAGLDWPKVPDIQPHTGG